MDIEKQFIHLSSFLKRYQDIWQKEILHLYPHSLDAYPKEWIESLTGCQSSEEILSLEIKIPPKSLTNPSLLALYREADELSTLPKIEPKTPLKSRWCTKHHMIPKKYHEIEKLTPLIDDFCQKQNIKKILDIGGGVGLLAQTLAQEYNYQVESFDSNLTFQNSGQERQVDIAPSTDHYVTFHHTTINEDNEAFLNRLDEKTLTTGLHTCGALANDQIKLSLKKKAKLINLGCCYHKLKVTDLNLSEFAKSNGLLEISHFALTLSARGHKKTSPKDLILKQKVKYYRYALHMLMHDYKMYDGYATLGNSHPSIYDLPFSEYVKEQFQRINMPLTLLPDELNSYYHDPKRQKCIQDMLVAGHIRDIFGRPLEVYIQLDRALFLEEQGYHVEIFEIFKEEISPRNICLSASPQKNSENA